MAGDYAGESIAKKVARIRLYRRTRQALVHRMGIDAVREMRVLFLPGPNASEVGALKHILGVRPENVLGIDIDPAACARLKERWPEVEVFRGDLAGEETQRFVVDRVKKQEGGGFEFVHLDLMGNLSSRSEHLYAVWSRFVRRDGVLAATYLRGRETSRVDPVVAEHRDFGVAEVARMRSCNAGECRRLLKMLAPDPERALSHLIALNEAIAYMQAIAQHNGDIERAIEAVEEFKRVYDEMMSEGSGGHAERFRREVSDAIGLFTPLACHAYRAEVSPMGVLATQRVTQTVLESLGYERIRLDTRRDTTSVIRKDAMQDLLAEADSLEKEFSQREVAEILDTTSGTLAAWRAHRTMGTYTD